MFSKSLVILFFVTFSLARNAAGMQVLEDKRGPDGTLHLVLRLTPAHPGPLAAPVSTPIPDGGTLDAEGAAPAGAPAATAGALAGAVADDAALPSAASAAQPIGAVQLAAPIDPTSIIQGIAEAVQQRCVAIVREEPQPKTVLQLKRTFADCVLQLGKVAFDTKMNFVLPLGGALDSLGVSGDLLEPIFGNFSTFSVGLLEDYLRRMIEGVERFANAPISLVDREDKNLREDGAFTQHGEVFGKKNKRRWEKDLICDFSAKLQAQFPGVIVVTDRELTLVSTVKYGKRIGERNHHGDPGGWLGVPTDVLVERVSVRTFVNLD